MLTISFAPNSRYNHHPHWISILNERDRENCPRRHRGGQRQIQHAKRRLLASLRAFPYEYDDEESDEFRDQSSTPRQDSRQKSRGQQKSPPSSSSSTKPDGKDFETALAIVPDIQHWDRLQRARHYAQDAIFQQWPPAIRLFHPFNVKTSTAFDVAQLIEDLDIEPFDVTLDTWVLVPHAEAMQTELQHQQSAPDIVDGTYCSQFAASDEEEARNIRLLIQTEERKSAQKAMVRNASHMNATTAEGTANGTAATVGVVSSSGNNATDQKKRRGPYRKKRTAYQRLEEEKLMEDDFDGPCILCLEPNEESKQLLAELREMLCDGLNHDAYFSPSSVYSWRYFKEIDMGFRPLIPIANFNSFRSGMEVARRLKGLWGPPLTIRVNDLHVISCRDDDDDDSGNTVAGDWDTNNGVDSRRTKKAAKEFTGRPFGCNAKIMLVGQEVEQDEVSNQRMVTKLVKEGELGGMDISADYTILDDEDESVSDIERWLDDDDFDEGSQVVIGRTHFYTGGQRYYKGMPATSTLDGKDRAM